MINQKTKYILKDGVSLSETPNQNQVAILAKLTNDLGSLHDNQKIPFNRMYTNVGGNFDAATSTFVCRIPGVYVFETTILAFPGKFAQVVIVKNDNILTNAYANAEGKTIGWDSGSTTAVVTLNLSDRVWVKVHITLIQLEMVIL